MAVESILSQIANGARLVLIRGAAGTGKTTLIGRLIPQLIGLRYNVALLTPTGRAAKVLQLRANHPASTIHSAIYKIDERPKEGREENGTLRWVFPIKTDRDTHTCFIVDEASLVGVTVQNEGVLQFGSGSLLKDLIQFSHVTCSQSENLLIFVGDPFQLPPVKEKVGDPPALSETCLTELTGCPVSVVELTEVHRQNAESGILAEANRLRSQISYHLFGAFSYRQQADICPVKEEMLETRYHPEVNLKDKIIIAYTNDRVWNLNQRVRKLLQRTSSLPEPGDYLMSLRNTMVGVSEGREVRFMNGDFLQVVTCEPTKLMKIKGFYHPKDSEKTFQYEFTFCPMRVTGLCVEDELDAEILVNITPITSAAYRENPEYAPIAFYVAVMERIHKKFNLSHSASDEQRAREYLKQSQFYHAPWVTFGYAITGHKSQGGEWNEVWVDYHYQQNRMTEDYFRWMYTVTTRAKKMLFPIAPPCFDDLKEALERGIQRVEALSSQSPTNLLCGSNTVGLSLSSILARQGYRIGEIVHHPFAVRVQLVKSDDPFAEIGYLDLNYNGKNMISYVRLSLLGASDELGSEIAKLKGRGIKVVISEAFPQDALSHENPKIEVLDSQGGVRDRLLMAAKNAGLCVLGMKSITSHQLRLELSSDMGEGYVDFYIDGKGRVTEMGSMTIGATALRKLKEGLTV